MQKQRSRPTNSTAGTTLVNRITSRSLQLAPSRAEHGRVRILPAAIPQAGSWVSSRLLRAALRAAELAAWQASGGDFLSSAAVPNS